MLPISCRRAILPQKCFSLQVVHFSDVYIDTERGLAFLDGRATPALVGNWMFYLPEPQLKFFHSYNGRPDCIHSSKPSNWRDGSQIDLNEHESRYSLAEWRKALEIPVSRRLAEIWIVSSRLWRAGLGPQPLGLCTANNLYRDGENVGNGCGIISQNVNLLVRKRPGTLEMVIDSGVVPDRIHSCTRQQLRGWIVDLCSVVGCTPIDGEDAVDSLLDMIEPILKSDASEPLLDKLLVSLKYW